MSQKSGFFQIVLMQPNFLQEFRLMEGKLFQLLWCMSYFSEAISIANENTVHQQHYNYCQFVIENIKPWSERDSTKSNSLYQIKSNLSLEQISLFLTGFPELPEGLLKVTFQSRTLHSEELAQTTEESSEFILNFPMGAIKSLAPPTLPFFSPPSLKIKQSVAREQVIQLGWEWNENNRPYQSLIYIFPASLQ